ncbi:MAG TPA: hypothetical protein VFT50_07020 [Baekduia sp.]|nr:hypothetical protein [Baekduia sp.]
MADATTHQNVRLARGQHASPDQGACVMELASMLAGERFSDHPRAVCPVIGSYLRRYNDGAPDDRRQDLLPVAAAIVGTAGDRELRRIRAGLCRVRLAALRGAERPPRRWTLCSWSWLAAECARTFLRAGRHDEAIAFAHELVAVGRPRPVAGAVSDVTVPDGAPAAAG